VVEDMLDKTIAFSDSASAIALASEYGETIGGNDAVFFEEQPMTICFTP